MTCSDFTVCPAMRKKIMELDENKCVRCDSEVALQVHHICYRVPCREKDMVTLCEKCHGFLHGLFKDASKMPKFSAAIKKRRKRKDDALY